jgi:hypothetical protein
MVSSFPKIKKNVIILSSDKHSPSPNSKIQSMRNIASAEHRTKNKSHLKRHSMNDLSPPNKMKIDEVSEEEEDERVYFNSSSTQFNFQNPPLLGSMELSEYNGIDIKFMKFNS